MLMLIKWRTLLGMLPGMYFEKGNDHKRKLSRKNSIALYWIKAKEKVNQEIDRRRKRLIKKT